MYLVKYGIRVFTVLLDDLQISSFLKLGESFEAHWFICRNSWHTIDAHHDIISTVITQTNGHINHNSLDLLGKWQRKHQLLSLSCLFEALFQLPLSVSVTRLCLWKAACSFSTGCLTIHPSWMPFCQGSRAHSCPEHSGVRVRCCVSVVKRKWSMHSGVCVRCCNICDKLYCVNRVNYQSLAKLRNTFMV